MIGDLQAYFPGLDIHFALQMVGIAGFLSYMAGFAALQLGLLDGNGPLYALTNVIGAVLVLVSLASAFNLASLLIQISWIVIGCYGIWRNSRRRPASFKSRRPLLLVPETTPLPEPKPKWRAHSAVRSRQIGKQLPPAHGKVYRQKNPTPHMRTRMTAVQPTAS